jgi:glycerol-1-phosphate dehydrogenase [NAD(P)+]
MDRQLLELAKRPDLRVGHAILEEVVLGLPGSYALITQPDPLAQVAASVTQRAATTYLVTSLEEADLERVARELPDVEHVVGVGGGMTMDTAKFIAWKRGIPLVLAPSIVSVDASVTNTVAIRRNGTVEYEGFVVARPIVADLDLISTAPARLNRAGVGDLLSIHTGRFDWALGAKAGRIAFDDDIDTAAASVLEALYGMGEEVAAVSDRALEHVIRAYVAVNSLLLDAGHSGPEEGSEHYFGYAAESVTGRSFVHGELISLGTVLMSGLQDNDQARAAEFLDRCRVEWRPERLGLDRSTLEQILVSLPAFVRRAGLPHSIIDEVSMDRETVSWMLASIPAERRNDPELST